MDEIEQSLISIRKIFVNCPLRREILKEQLTKCDQEIQDLLHVIELAPLSASNGYKYAKELQNARKLRRELKDELELLEPIKELISFGKPTEKNINRILGDVRNIKKRQEVRTYKMRVREDLQEIINK